MSAANVKNPPVHCPSVRPSRAEDNHWPLSHLFARPPRSTVTDVLAPFDPPPSPSMSEDRPRLVIDPVLCCSSERDSSCCVFVYSVFRHVHTHKRQPPLRPVFCSSTASDQSHLPPPPRTVCQHLACSIGAMKWEQEADWRRRFSSVIRRRRTETFSFVC